MTTKLFFNKTTTIFKTTTNYGNTGIIPIKMTTKFIIILKKPFFKNLKQYYGNTEIIPLNMTTKLIIKIKTFTKTKQNYGLFVCFIA